MFAFATARRPRRPSLTPMIDVVFLLLVFFMLAARFGHDFAIELGAAGQGGAWTGPPRLVEFGPAGLWFNGVAMDRDDLLADLARVTTGPEDAVVLRARDGADLQSLVDMMQALRTAGYTRLLVAE